MGLEQVRVLVKHQRARMRLEDLGRDADRVQRLVEVTEGALWHAQSEAIAHQWSDLTIWMMAGPRSTIHSTGKMQPTIGNTMRDDAWAARS